ncbi:MAG: hypothetical protein MJ117_11055, partial [Lachnospiraceae bacterium]|nr:hypothetical protein [Lachnospiraceae bacterium]
PSLSQAQRIKKLAQNPDDSDGDDDDDGVSGGCTLENMCSIMEEVKKEPANHVTLKTDVLSRYFPKSFTPKQMEETIIKLLDQWQKKKLRDQER